MPWTEYEPFTGLHYHPLFRSLYPTVQTCPDSTADPPTRVDDHFLPLCGREE